MPALVSLVFMLLFQVGAPASGLDVQAHEGQVTLRAQKVPLSKVLDRLAQQTGMKVVYESAPPSQPVSASFDHLPPRDAVVRLLEGQGVSYVFRTDPSGRSVETLLVSGDSGTRQASASGGGAQPEMGMEYNAEVVDEVNDYEEPPPPPAPAETVQDPGLPAGVVQTPSGAFVPQEPIPSFPGGPAFPGGGVGGIGGSRGGAPSFPGPVSNPFPN